LRTGPAIICFNAFHGALLKTRKCRCARHILQVGQPCYLARYTFSRRYTRRLLLLNDVWRVCDYVDARIVKFVGLWVEWSAHAAGKITRPAASGFLYGRQTLRASLWHGWTSMFFFFFSSVANDWLLRAESEMRTRRRI
jgi:hypothetical protein